MRILLSFLIMLLLFVSCDGNRAVSTNGAADSSVETGDSGPVRSQDRVNSIEKAITEERTKKKSHQNVVSIENYGEKRFLMAGKSNPVTPYDFIIGKIVDTAQLSDSPEAALTRFLDGYRSGKVSKNPADYFMGDNQTLLTMLFEEWFDSRLIPGAFRIGNSISGDQETKVTARLFMDSGSCVCEFVLAKDGKRWKVQNFSGNLEEMTAPDEKTEEFEPEVYYFF